VEVHNLCGVDLDIPHRELVIFCGVSGSGKTSLALDTLYAEGQRRYIETFSAYTRQFLEQLEKPAAERIDGLPPAIAVTHSGSSQSSRATVATATEIADHLRLLYARIGQVICLGCGREVKPDTPQEISEELATLPPGSRFMVTFPIAVAEGECEAAVAALQENGFVRAIIDGQTVALADASSLIFETCDVVVDRLKAGDEAEERLRDSLEITFSQGEGRCNIYAEQPLGSSKDDATITIDGRSWFRRGFSNQLNCADCGRDYPKLEPRLFSFNSPLGACPACEGFGNVVEIDMELIVPDVTKSIRDGAIAPWTTPAYSHELEELLALADDYDLPVDVPFSELSEQQRQLIEQGVPEREFGGLNGFFAWLEKRKYKMHLRVFLSRWRSYRTCATCHGTRLRKDALATLLGGKKIAEVFAMKISDLRVLLRSLDLTDWQQRVGRMMLGQVGTRLSYLERVGLGYLTLDRTLRTLSGGEMQRVALTATLGSSLVNMLYVLDEPTVGLHPRDVGPLVSSITDLRDRGNTVVVVEHEPEMICEADRVVEIGPGAGRQGGHIVFSGEPAQMLADSDSVTGDFLAGRRGAMVPQQRRATRGGIRLAGARGNNLRSVDVEFPLGVLCLVTGVSGSGKSTLVQNTLYGALCRRKRKDSPKPYPYDDVYGDGQIDDVVLIDQSPIGRSGRSNPVTYIKAFDAIRAVFAETLEARTHNYTASHFSFNVDGGRCNACKGDGYTEIDMQFLANVLMKCSECGGRRYRREILEVTYRGKNIADVLAMTVREGFAFFRGKTKVQGKLKQLMDVGLDYLQLGQPAATLSSGEAQRLKLAAFLSTAKRGRTLFILDEPTTGLHFADVMKLLDCFDALIAVGHSLIIVEHSLQLMKAADHIIDMGPGAADEGGQVVATGTPEQIATSPESITGPYLAEALAEEQRMQAS